MEHQGTRWHPISGHLISAIHGSEGSLEAQALTLAIAVEGLLKTEFTSLGAPDKATLKEIDAACDIINQSSLGDPIKERITSVLGNFKNPRARDRLMVLVQSKSIRERLAKTWQRLRNSHAHGDPFEVENFDQLFADINDVQTLLHELAFIAVGYTGMYSDYSEAQWPPKLMKAQAAGNL